MNEEELLMQINSSLDLIKTDHNNHEQRLKRYRDDIDNRIECLHQRVEDLDKQLKLKIEDYIVSNTTMGESLRSLLHEQ